MNKTEFELRLTQLTQEFLAEVVAMKIAKWQCQDNIEKKCKRERRIKK